MHMPGADVVGSIADVADDIDYLVIAGHPSDPTEDTSDKGCGLLRIRAEDARGAIARLKIESSGTWQAAKLEVMDGIANATRKK